MFKSVATFYHYLTGTLIVILLVSAFLFATMQTKWAKIKLQEKLVAFAEERGIDLTIGSFEGRLPFKWTLVGVHAKLPSGDHIDAESVRVRLAFFPLLKKEIAIDYLSAQNMVYTRVAAEEMTLSELSTTAATMPQMLQESLQGTVKDVLEELPYSLSVKTFKIPSLHLVNKASQERANFSVEGSGKIKRRFKRFFLHLSITSPDFPGSHGTLFFDGDQSQDHINFGINLKMKSMAPLKPFTTPPFDADFALQSSIEGPWETWQALFYPEEIVLSNPLQGHLKTSWERLEIPGFEILNHKGKSDATFLLTPERTLDVKQWVVTSPLIHFNSKGSIDLHNEDLITTTTSFSLPNLSLFTTSSGFPLDGALRGEFKCDKTDASLEWMSEEIKLGSHPFTSVQGQMTAMRENIQDPTTNHWTGEATLSAKSSALSLEGESHFEFVPFKTLDLNEITLKGPDTLASGHLVFDIERESLLGMLAVHAAELDHFEPFFPGSHLKGSLGAQLRLSKKTQKHLQEHLEEPSANPDLSTLDFHVQFSGLNYKNMHAQEITLRGTLLDLFSYNIKNLRGSIFLEGERTYFPELFFSSYSLNTHWDNHQWPFEIDIKGRFKEPIDLQASGSFQKENDLTSLQITTLSGHVLSKPFHSLATTKFQWEKERFQLSDLSFRIDEGVLSMDIDLSPLRSLGKVKATHIPLDLLSLFYPAFSLQGTVAIDGALKATHNDIQGRLDLVLEHAKIPLDGGIYEKKKGKQIATQAKGTLQAHLDNNTLQFQADLKATEDQFLQWTATLPLLYKPFPFALTVDKNKPLSSELVFEGKLEEVFDFINAGSHRLTGLLGAHLFLSKSLEAPSLQGSIHLSNGSYENEYTGTVLKNINAEALAEGRLLALTQFSATDGAEGKMQATGDLAFNPVEKFPYTIHAELDNLNCMRFDLLTSNLTGPFDITGTTESALAKGNLTVSKATIQIPDSLPPDFIQLPVTYVNFPHQPDEVATTSSSTFFPLLLEMDLSAPDHIYVKGKGLESEWEGTATLRGTNDNIAASGHLSLLKGKYSFSGQIFELTKGEITFSEKVNQQALITLSGTLTLPDMTITALLSGPLMAPKLQFSSVPQMPTSSILAHILFNKDVSEISPMQAIQLAQTIMTISGSGGTDVLEAIRKTIGVDRLNITTRNGSDEIALQIGKYLTKGVLVTLAQSTDSSQIIVEVELKHGFVLQAETQEDEEGKFSLKWNKNY